jgi:hypothetical protein
LIGKESLRGEKTSQGGDRVERTVETTDGEPAKPFCSTGHGSQAGIHVSVRQRGHLLFLLCSLLMELRTLFSFISRQEYSKLNSLLTACTAFYKNLILFI